MNRCSAPEMTSLLDTTRSRSSSALPSAQTVMTRTPVGGTALVPDAGKPNGLRDIGSLAGGPPSCGCPPRCGSWPVTAPDSTSDVTAASPNTYGNPECCSDACTVMRVLDRSSPSYLRLARWCSRVEYACQDVGQNTRVPPDMPNRLRSPSSCGAERPDCANLRRKRRRWALVQSHRRSPPGRTPSGQCDVEHVLVNFGVGSVGVGRIAELHGVAVVMLSPTRVASAVSGIVPDWLAAGEEAQDGRMVRPALSERIGGS